MAKKIKMVASSRGVSIAILEKIEKDQAYSNLLINQAVKESKLDKKEIPLLTELVYGVLQNKLALDFHLEPYINNPQKLESWVKQVLRISVYQFLYLDNIPDHAIINEGVDLGKKMGHQGIGKLINGILRSFQRQGSRSFEEIKNQNERLSIKYSIPLWIINDLVKAYSFSQTEEIAKAFHNRAKGSLRVNLGQISRQEAMEQLVEEGYQVELSQLSPSGLLVEKGTPSQSDLFKKGLITIQDESSMLVAEAMTLKANHQVLDACAAPGGKTTHMVNFLTKEAGGQVHALDIHKHKVRLIQESVERQNQADFVQTKLLDARQSLEEFGTESFDRVLVDAPCSGMGLMRRKPDIRYNKKPKDIKQLQKIQAEILDAVCETVKKGGRLVYSTCTILPEENQNTVQAFLENHKDFKLLKGDFNNEKLNKYHGENGLTILPQFFDSDGFFISIFERI